jgi:predicted site-specific integrase-resolvase
MKLSEWAKRQGITYKTAWRWFQQGRLPVPAEQAPSGTIIVYPDYKPEAGTKAVLYARVSGSGQKDDLQRQAERLDDYAARHGFSVIETVAEVGSGLNGKRPKLLKVLENPQFEVIVVEHRDRLARFGSEYIEAALKATGRRLVVVDASEMKDDLVQDMVDVLTSFCARLYGKRAAKNKAQKAVEAIQDSK